MQERGVVSTGNERIYLSKPIARGWYCVLCCLFLAAIGIACFSINGLEHIPRTISGGEAETKETSEQNPVKQEENTVLEGAVKIIGMDLSDSTGKGSPWNNESGIQLDFSSIIAESTEKIGVSEENKPVVLILHTHPTEAYLKEPADWLEGVIGDVTYSEDESRSVIAVGEALCQTLNENGIPTIHCKEITEGGRTSGAYARSAKLIASYLEKYPSIRFVIDLHRDGILCNDDYVRTESPNKEAQILFVVGTDANGTEFDTWKQNLALSVALKDDLNDRFAGLCRPILIKAASMNQELAPHFLTVEIGSGGNTVAEAIRSAQTFGQLLATRAFETD